MKRRFLCLSIALLACSQTMAAGKPSTFSCSAKKVRLTDTLTIQLPAKHGAELAIVDPDDKYWFIAFPQSDPKSKLKPLIPEAAFQKTSAISHKVSDFRGVLWESDQESYEPKKIFSQPGKYTVKLAATLETEDPELDGQCVLEYTGK